jgi:outer membrane protein insertion porin family
MPRPTFPARLTLAHAALAAALLPVHAWAQDAAPAAAAPASPPGASEIIDEQLAALEGRPVREVQTTGVAARDAELVRNQVRVLAGQPLDALAVREDVRRLARLGRFEKVEALLRQEPDTSVTVIYACTAAPIIEDVQAAGNREVTDAELGEVVGLSAGVPANQFLLDGAKRRIVELYQKRGYYQADVQIDQRELAERGIVVFRIREGDPVKVTSVRYEIAGSNQDARGEPIARRQLVDASVTREWTLLNLAPSTVTVTPRLKLDEAVRTPVTREPRERKARTGYLNDDDLSTDTLSIEGVFANEGYLNARVDRSILLAPNGREAIVTFIIDTGPRYTVRGLEVVTADGSGDGSGQPTTVISPAQAAGLIPLRAGDALTTDAVTRSAAALRDAYLRLGYVDATVRAFTRQAVGAGPGAPQADVLLIVQEGKPALTGLVSIKGNELTQSRVVRRLVTVKPDRPLDGVALRDTEQRLRDSQLFDQNAIRVTTQRENPANPGYRDVLVEVAETNTGSLQFGASVSSDGGVVGQIALTQRNFDVQDTPDSLDELIRGQAFRGAAQTFNLTLAPGNESQQYSISLSDPALFESDYSGSGAFGYTTRQWRRYDEDRFSLRAGVGRRFGERWNGSLGLRVESINIRDIDPDAATDVFRDRGSNLITGIEFSLSRRDLDRPIRPTLGTLLQVGLERAGILGGDYQFTRLGAEATAYVPVDEDALGMRTVLQLRTSARYIPEDVGDVPVAERLFLGGRDFRGFRVRGVGPRGIRNDNNSLFTTDSVGGTWAFFLGAQLEKPLVDEFLSVVGFIDSGTVNSTITLAPYRAAVGAGVRIYIPQLGPVPLAFDYAVPIADETGDERRAFSFSLDVPF